MIDERTIAEKFERLAPVMGEFQRRIWAASEALAIGRGGVSLVQRATGIARSTINRGIAELESGEVDRLAGSGRHRRPGGGRKRLEESRPALGVALDALVDPVTRGDPESPLRWTTKSTEKLASSLRGKGFEISARTVASMLRKRGYSLQSARKRLEGTNHPDRDAQFRYIARHVRSFQRRDQPVISVDTKKKELIGAFHNGGREWQPSGEPVAVNSHDFPSLSDGRAVPYGVYDVTDDTGFVSVGVAADTSEFAVESIRGWWEQLGRKRYADAGHLLITANCGGSNGYRTRLWKAELQRLADETRLTIRVAHYPPGTSKWNKIEHRLFCHIATNWRGRPLLTHQVVVDLIASTTTTTGLEVFARLDPRTYEKGRKVSKEEMAALKIKRAAFHGEWNYVFKPRSRL
jgi:hypothetical protein